MEISPADNNTNPHVQRQAQRLLRWGTVVGIGALLWSALEFMAGAITLVVVHFREDLERYATSPNQRAEVTEFLSQLEQSLPFALSSIAVGLILYAILLSIFVKIRRQPVASLAIGNWIFGIVILACAYSTFRAVWEYSLASGIMALADLYLLHLMNRLRLRPRVIYQ